MHVRPSLTCRDDVFNKLTTDPFLSQLILHHPRLLLMLDQASPPVQALQMATYSTRDFHQPHLYVAAFLRELYTDVLGEAVMHGLNHQALIGLSVAA